MTIALKKRPYQIFAKLSMIIYISLTISVQVSPTLMSTHNTSTAHCMTPFIMIKEHDASLPIFMLLRLCYF